MTLGEYDPVFCLAQFSLVHFEELHSTFLQRQLAIYNGYQVLDPFRKRQANTMNLERKSERGLINYIVRMTNYVLLGFTDRLATKFKYLWIRS